MLRFLGSWKDAVDGILNFHFTQKWITKCLVKVVISFFFQLKNHLSKAKIFMNGGFVTLRDMSDAVSKGWTNGISLGRPVAAEPGNCSLKEMCCLNSQKKDRIL